GLLPEPPSAQVPLAAEGGPAVARVLRRSRRDLSGQGQLGTARRARAASSRARAGTSARAGRWQIAGRVPDGRGRSRAGPRFCQAPPDRAVRAPQRDSRLVAGGGRPVTTEIRKITGRRVWDSRARPTVEVEVELAGGARGRAIAPAGASRGKNEAADLRDGGLALGGFGVERAVANVNEAIAST